MNELSLAVGTNQFANNKSQFVFDKETLETFIGNKTAELSTMAYSNSVDLGKDLASCRKLQTSINNEVKAVKKAYMKPFDDFKKEVDAISGNLTILIGDLSNKKDDFEKERIRLKNNEICNIFKETIVDVPEDSITLEKIFNPKWLNKTTSNKSIKTEMQEFLTNFNKEIKRIEESFEEKEFIDDVKTEYYKNLDFDAAFRKYQNMVAAKKAMEKAEAERLEAEKLEAEKKKAEEEKAKQQKPEPETSNPFLDLEKEKDPLSISPAMTQPARKEESTPRLINSTININCTPDKLNKLISYMISNGIDFKKIN